jgi:nucleotide-binding universal stress UspA family protein
MLSIRTVLCPVDFSSSTDHQVDLAVDLCRAFGARLVLQHNKVELAVGAGVGWMWEPGHTAGALTPEQKIEELRVRVPAGIDAELRLTRGAVVDAVVAVSRAVDADLVVLSVRGSASDGDDSITDRLLESALLPIFAVHDTLHERRSPRFAEASGTPQALLVPTDFTPASQPAMDLAFDLSRRFAFEVHLLHVLPHGAPEDAADEAGRRMTALAPADLPRQPHHHVVTGIPAQAIARAADDVAAVCVVMGEHERTPARHWFRSDTSRAVLHPSPCPIWYVPIGVRPSARAAQAPALSRNLVEELQDTGFHYWPSSYLHGVVDSVEDAESALGEMIAAGIPRDQLHTWFGAAGSAAIDGRNRGRMARLWRTLEKATPERELLERYASEVDGGHVCIGIQIGSQQGVRVLTDILKQHGGHLISYFTVGSVQHMN